MAVIGVTIRQDTYASILAIRRSPTQTRGRNGRSSQPFQDDSSKNAATAWSTASLQVESPRYGEQLLIALALQRAAQPTLLLDCKFVASKPWLEYLKKGIQETLFQVDPKAPHDSVVRAHELALYPTAARKSNTIHLLT